MKLYKSSLGELSNVAQGLNNNQTNEQEYCSDEIGSLKIEWMTTDEAAIFLRLSVKALRNLTSRGGIPFYKFGRRVRYRRDELECLLLQEKRGKYGDQV